MLTSFSSVTIIKFTNIFQDLAISKLTSEDHIIGEKNIICKIDENGVKRIKKKKCFFVITEDQEALTLRRIIKQYAKPRSIVHMVIEKDIVI
ncbi:hypothetical protein F8M41_005697 [Gigaspora margarita]|uniref:Uncharacterized protein n=1 Tax=Gigaspora margarita TaxID=4874 RepID=A0A8H4A4Q2_GIGMA|nr:hypothetical protein F8M41_005697 [Gigaspora margarita]